MAQPTSIKGLREALDELEEKAGTDAIRIGVLAPDPSARSGTNMMQVKEVQHAVYRDEITCHVGWLILEDYS